MTISPIDQVHLTRHPCKTQGLHAQSCNRLSCSENRTCTIEHLIQLLLFRQDWDGQTDTAYCYIGSQNDNSCQIWKSRSTFCFCTCKQKKKFDQSGPSMIGALQRSICLDSVEACVTVSPAADEFLSTLRRRLERLGSSCDFRLQLESWNLKVTRDLAACPGTAAALPPQHHVFKLQEAFLLLLRLRAAATARQLVRL
jgi:hypothetical protein